MPYNNTNYTDEQIKRIKSLLLTYRQAHHGVSNKLAYTGEEYYEASRKQLSGIIDSFITFENKEVEEEFYNQICTCRETPELLNLIEKALVILKDYPFKGDTYYKILEMLYFDHFSYTNEAVMEILGLPRTTYYRYLKGAYGCFYYHIIGVLGRVKKELHEEYPCDDLLD